MRLLSKLSELFSPFRVKSFRLFFWFWFTDFLSAFGSSITRFALGVWIFQTTGSAALLGLALALATLPQILLSPFAGTIVDSHPKILVLRGTNITSAFIILVLVISSLLGFLSFFLVVAAIFLLSVCAAFHTPSQHAVLKMLVPSELLSRANGIIQSGISIDMLLSPLVGASILAWMSIDLVFIVDLLTFGFPLFFLLLNTFGEDKYKNAKRTFIEFIKTSFSGFKLAAGNPSLLILLCAFACSNFFGSAVTTLTTPFFLKQGSPILLGMANSISGACVLISSLVLIFWQGPLNQNRAIYILFLIGGLVLSAFPFAGTEVAIALLGAKALLNPMLNSLSTSIWLRETDVREQGRVFAARRLVSWAPVPLGQITAGWLTDFLGRNDYVIPVIGAAGKDSRIPAILICCAGICLSLIGLISIMFNHRISIKKKSGMEDAPG